MTWEFGYVLVFENDCIPFIEQGEPLSEDETIRETKANTGNEN
jgi:hypothetical protein